MEIIKFTNLTENSTFILDNNNNLSKYKFLTINDSLKVSQPFKDICLTEKPISVKCYYVENAFKGWKHSDTLDIISEDEYSEKLSNLRKDCFIDDITKTNFKSLQDEVVYNRFIRTYNKHFVLEDKFDVLEIIIDKTISTNNPYIKSMRLLGKEISNPTCHYSPQPFKLATEIAEEMGFKFFTTSTSYKNSGLNWSVPDHSKNTLEFMQICGKYATSSSKKLHFSPITGTLKECEERYLQHVNSIKQLFQDELDIINVVPLATKGIVKSNIENIKTQIYNLDVKVVSSAAKRQLLINVQDLIDSLK